MTPAKAIAMTNDATRNLKVLAGSLIISVIVLDVVSLLIGGVLSPLRPEW